MRRRRCAGILFATYEIARIQIRAKSDGVGFCVLRQYRKAHAYRRKRNASAVGVRKLFDVRGSCRNGDFERSGKTRFRRFGRRLHEKDILLVLLGRLQSARNRATSLTQYKHDKTASRKGHKESKKLALRCNQIAKTVTLIM